MEFLKFPPEVRLMIYKFYFEDTILHHTHDPPETKPNALGTYTAERIPSPLSILLSSREIHTEIQPLWPSLITFSFASTEKFLDCLTQPPASTLSQIRKALVLRAHPLCLFPYAGSQGFNSWSFPECLSLLPGLRLDSLYLGDVWHDEDIANSPPCDEFWSDWNADIAAYKLIERILQTDGWRDVTILSPTASMLTWKSLDRNNVNGSKYMRWSQPGQWRDVLRERDGAGDGSSANVFLASQDSCASLTHAPPSPGDAWEPYEQQGSSPGGSTNWPIEAEAPKMHKQTLVVIRRGQGVLHEQKGAFLRPLRHATRLLEEAVGGMSWKQLKDEGLVWDPRNDLSACMT